MGVAMGEQYTLRSGIIFTSFVLTPVLTCRFEAMYSVPTFCTDLSQQNVRVMLKEFIKCTHRFLIKASVCIFTFILSWDVRILSVMKSTYFNADNVPLCTKIAI
jgi:hypothetical protein